MILQLKLDTTEKCHVLIIEGDFQGLSSLRDVISTKLNLADKIDVTLLTKDFKGDNTKVRIELVNRDFPSERDI